MIFGMGPTELLIILLVVLVIFGPKNLPKLGKTLGETVKNVREGMDDGEPKQVAEKAEAAAPAAAVEADEVVDVEDVVFCSKCGAKNSTEDAFCSKCGAKLASE